jgi:hypothetical protein
MPRRLFLQRRTYRQNRLQDAARLLPVLGIVMIFAPIFIRDTGTLPPDAQGVGLGTWLIYYFAVWLGLILLTALVGRGLRRLSPDAAGEEADGAGPAPGAGPRAGLPDERGAP